jgi:N-acetylmuramoyl-L-alanine amidase
MHAAVVAVVREKIVPVSFRWLVVAAGFVAAGVTGCRTTERTFVARKGDEIVVAGQLFHTGTRVITWMDPKGYDAYRVERRFSPYAESDWEKTQAAAKEITSPNRYGLRAAMIPAG